MTEELRVRSDKDDVGSLLGDLAERADEESLSLRSTTRISAGEWVRFIVQLRDETTVLEGVGRCLGSERNGESFDVTLDQLQLDERSEIMFERIQLERESRAFGEITTGVVELTEVPAPLDRPSPPPLPPRAKPSTAPPPARAKPSAPPPTRAKPSAPPPPRAKPSAPPPAKVPPTSKAKPSTAPSKPARAARTAAPAKPKQKPSTAPPKREARAEPQRTEPQPVLRSPRPSTPDEVSPDLGSADTEIVRDPSLPSREAATREISVDRTALPIPADLAVRAAALVPRLERATQKSLTTHAVLLAAMRVGMTAIETQNDPEAWEPPDEV